MFMDDTAVEGGAREILSLEDFIKKAESIVSEDGLKKIADLIASLLKEKDMVETPFGNFRKMITENREALNPQTGEKITITSRLVLRWDTTREFYDRVKNQ